MKNISELYGVTVSVKIQITAHSTEYYVRI